MSTHLYQALLESPVVVTLILSLPVSCYPGRTHSVDGMLLRAYLMNAGVKVTLFRTF